MTREEQMRKAAIRAADNSNEFFLFTRGVKWADENPKEGLVSLDKVCEHLTYVLPHYVSSDYVNVIIEGLHKAMEG